MYIGSQDGPKEADKIAALPEQPRGDYFDQYSGYVTVDAECSPTILLSLRILLPSLLFSGLMEVISVILLYGNSLVDPLQFIYEIFFVPYTVQAELLPWPCITSQVHVLIVTSITSITKQFFYN